MDRCPNLKVISNHGVGVDHINLTDAAERGIPVGNTPGCLDASTADMTMALILATARNVVVGDHFARGPEFTEYKPALLIGQEVTGSTLGIVGMGRIGAQVARRAKAFDIKLDETNARIVNLVSAEMASRHVSHIQQLSLHTKAALRDLYRGIDQDFPDDEVARRYAHYMDQSIRASLTRRRRLQIQQRAAEQARRKKEKEKTANSAVD